MNTRESKQIVDKLNEQHDSYRATDINVDRWAEGWRLHLKMKVDHDVLMATASGQVAWETQPRALALALINGAVEFAVAAGLNKVLLDCHKTTGTLTRNERYELGQELAWRYKDLGVKLRLTVVGDPPLINGYAAKTATLHGQPTAAFRERAPALAWLRGLQGLVSL